jgi:hypothetical protein
MGGGASSGVEGQERYVAQHLHDVKKRNEGLSDTQLKGRLRQEYHGDRYREKDSWVLDRTWERIRRH